MTLDVTYFDRLYDGEADPWQFRTRPYEARKRALTLAALPAEFYATVFEPGCSIGVLSGALAERCDRLLAMDISAEALRLAQPAVPRNVELRLGAVPSDWPAGSFDLVVLSEMGYYLDTEDVVRLAALATGSARDLLAVHWRHPVADYPLSGDDVHAALDEAAGRAGMRRLVDHVEDDLRLNVWSHDGRSVAERTGVPHE